MNSLNSSELITKTNILITGDRNYTDIKTIEVIFDLIKIIFLPEKTTVNHGNCKGADILAGSVAEKLNYTINKFPAEWNKYGKYAGPKRNQEMVNLKNDLILIFHDDLKNSKGTKNCVTYLLKQINEQYKPILMLNGVIKTKEELQEIIKN
jgi:hypothetical protein